MFESLRTEKTPDLCKHNNNSATCELCKMSLDEARIEADIMKGDALLRGSNYKEGEERIRSLVKGSIDNDPNVIQSHTPEDRLTYELMLGELVTAMETQIFRLTSELKRIKESPSDTFSEYEKMSNEDLKNMGISWNPDFQEAYNRIVKKIEKSKVA
ncbi:MAG: hypothetical protein NTV03_02390 [Candidatus Nomurabacteria bacterium]|nr:hypothetical protein [Candidatus Nomurabacteria bacterium]